MTRSIRTHRDIHDGNDPQSRIEAIVMIALLLAALVLTFPRG